MIRTGAGTSSISAGDIAHKVVSLDDLLAEFSVDLIKIDTDGYEVDVLRGAQQTLNRNDAPCFVEFSPWHLMTYGKVEPAEVIALMRNQGYRFGIIYDNLGYPMGLTELTDEVVRNLVVYCRCRPHVYADLLMAKNLDLLEKFYTADLSRYPLADWNARS